MKIRNGFTSKDLLDAQPSELICFELEDKRTWGVLLNRADDHVLVGILAADGPLEHGPFGVHWGYSLPCISYGTEWELEPLPGPETIPGSDAAVNTPGALYTVADGFCLRFGPAPKGTPRSDFCWNFATGKSSRPVTGDSAPILRWRIWANAAAPRHAAENPLIEFDASAAIRR